MTLLQIEGACLYEAAHKMQQSKLLFHLMRFPYNTVNLLQFLQQKQTLWDCNFMQVSLVIYDKNQHSFAYKHSYR
jgi:hypothetical protein